jgi:hypothetical protein
MDAVQQTIAEEAETDDAKNQDAAANASPDGGVTT